MLRTAGCGGARPLVEPVSAAVECLLFVTGGQPFPGQVAEPEVVGAPGPPILVGARPGSTALLYTSGQMRATATARVVMNSFCLVRAGLALSAPVHRSQVGSSAVMRAAAEIDQPLRAIDEGGEWVRGNDVDRHDLPAAT